ncbi:MAG: zf-HC2 domain-containing protein [Armatimonadota bacterium]|nr:zf-HC2 domain-containing protein [Armatimonadota bacterium]
MDDSHDLRTCLQAIGLLDDYLSRELNPETAQEVDAHLRLCEECARRFGFEKWLREYLRDRLRSDTAPPRLHEFLNRLTKAP